MAERTFLINYPSSLKTHWKQQKTPKEENIISNETRKEPQPQTAKYEDYLPNTEELWSKKKDVERWPKQKNKKPPQTSNLGQATDSEKYISPESSFQQSFDYSDEV